MIKLTIIIVFNLKSTTNQFNDCKIENKLNNSFSKTNSKIQLEYIKSRYNIKISTNNKNYLNTRGPKNIVFSVSILFPSL
ncbi:hypothetical protein CAPN010_19010 [Capnocytophaga cynodegmi]|nr:hypothetical protein CAPN010_19010 [Capnocytophaga cynodegmi]